MTLFLSNKPINKLLKLGEALSGYLAFYVGWHNHRLSPAGMLLLSCHCGQKVHEEASCHKAPCNLAAYVLN
jgi:hypothetical protein